MKTRNLICLGLALVILSLSGQNIFAQQVADQLTYDGEAGDGVLVTLNGTSKIVVYHLPFSFSAGETLPKITLYMAGFRTVEGKRYRAFDIDQTAANFRVESIRRSVANLQDQIANLKNQLSALAAQPDSSSPEVFSKMETLFTQVTNFEAQLRELH